MKRKRESKSKRKTEDQHPTRILMRPGCKLSLLSDSDEYEKFLLSGPSFETHAGPTLSEETTKEGRVVVVDFNRKPFQGTPQSEPRFIFKGYSLVWMNTWCSLIATCFAPYLPPKEKGLTYSKVMVPIYFSKHHISIGGNTVDLRPKSAIVGTSTGPSTGSTRTAEAFLYRSKTILTQLDSYYCHQSCGFRLPHASVEKLIRLHSSNRRSVIWKSKRKDGIELEFINDEEGSVQNDFLKGSIFYDAPPELPQPTTGNGTEMVAHDFSINTLIRMCTDLRMANESIESILLIQYWKDKVMFSSDDNISKFTIKISSPANNKVAPTPTTWEEVPSVPYFTIKINLHVAQKVFSKIKRVKVKPEDPFVTILADANPMNPIFLVIRLSHQVTRWDLINKI